METKGETLAMSFLDATGLGTFWNKLKSTFQGPVSEVYKDALTPVNIMPNSDFSKCDSFVKHIEIPSLSAGTNVYLCNNYLLRVNPGHTFTNGVVDFSDRSFTVSGNISNTDGTWTSRIIVFSSAILKSGTTYTFICESSSEYSDYCCNGNQSGSGTTIFSGMVNGKSVCVFTPAGTTYKQNLNISIFREVEASSTPISCTVSNVACYEGSFKDIAYHDSPDVSLFDLYNDYNFSTCYNIGFTRDFTGKNHWTRIACLGTNSEHTYSTFLIDMCNNPASNYGNFARFYISTYGSIRSSYLTVDKKFKGYYLADNTGTNGISSIDKARLATYTINDVSYIFFEVYSTSSSFQQYRVHLEQKLLRTDNSTFYGYLKQIKYFNENFTTLFGTNGDNDVLSFNAHLITMTYD